MNTPIITMFISISSLLLIVLAFYKALVKKKGKVSNVYTPYDDLTRGTNDTSFTNCLEEDMRHASPIAENNNVH